MKTKKRYTPQQYRRFKKLVDKAGSRVQMERIESRIEMPKFIAEVGKDVCDEMFAVMTRNDRKESK